MSEYKVSVRYATSLLDTAIEKNIVETVSRDVELIHSAIDSSRQLQSALSNPVVKPNVKLSVLEEIFKSKIGDETMNFLKFLVEKNRENLLNSIASIYLELRDKYLGIVNVNVRTAVKFTDEQISQLKSNFEKYLNKKVKINFSIDPSTIGGFIAQVGDTVFDASLSHQLELLKKQFLKGGVSLN
ncbi:MAG: ATP synthase F1 subunit delta [Ignavibacteriaceae bacterium]